MKTTSRFKLINNKNQISESWYLEIDNETGNYYLMSKIDNGSVDCDKNMHSLLARWKMTIGSEI